MTNYEKLTDEQKKRYMTEEFAVDVKTNEINPCARFDCAYCRFNASGTNCIEDRRKWLDEEEPQFILENIPVDTKVLVSSDGRNWRKMYYAGFDSDGNALVFADGCTSWSCGNGDVVKVRYVRILEDGKEQRT